MTTAADKARRIRPDPTTRSLDRSDRLQPILLIGAIAVGLGIARVWPDLASSLGPLVSVGVFVLIYLALVTVDAASISAAFAERSFVALAVGLNFVVNPLLAWCLATFFLGSEPELRAGLILFLVTPCIGWYLVFTELAGGDTALGLSLLGVNVVLQVLLLPLYLQLFVGEAAGVDLAVIAASILTFLIAPAVAAVLTRRLATRAGTGVARLANRVPLSAFKTTALIVVVVSMFASQADTILGNPSTFLALIAPLTLFFAITFSVALAVGRARGLPYAHTALLAFTTTSRNSEASLAIAATAFASPLVGLVVVLGPVVELPLLVLMVRALVGLRPWVSATA